MKLKRLRKITVWTGRGYFRPDNEIVDVPKEIGDALIKSNEYALIEPEKPDIESMKKAELEDYALEHGIDISEADKKSEILEIIKAEI